MMTVNIYQYIFKGVIIIKIFTIIGLVWFLFGFVCFQPIIHEIEGYCSPVGREITTATIEDVKYDPTSRNDDIIIISYEIKDEIYNITTLSPKLNVKKGDKLKIAYKTDNYSNIQFLKLNIGSVVLMGMLSLSCFFCGSYLVYVSIGVAKEVKKEKKFKRNSKVISADFVTLEKSDKRDSEGAPYYYVICEWYNKDDGMTYTFKSKEIENFLSELILKRNVKNFKVYIDKNDFRKYIVSTDELEELELEELQNFDEE